MSGPAGAAEPRIVTPEAVPLDLPLAGVGSRALGYLVDAAILGLALLALSLTLPAFADPLAGAPGWVGVTLAVLLAFAVQFGYPVGFETLWRGRTPGKALLGLRVVTAEGAPVAFRHAALRAALGLVDFLATVGAAALVTALVTRRTQRLGDLVAGTLVLRERSGAGRAVHATFEPPAGLEEFVARLDVAAMGPPDYQTVRSLLLRAPGFAPDVRRRLTEQVATSLSARIQPPPPPGLDAESWLRAVAAAYQRRHRGPAPAPTAGTAPPPSPRTPWSAGAASAPPPPPPPPPRPRAPEAGPGEGTAGGGSGFVAPP